MSTFWATFFGNFSNFVIIKNFWSKFSKFVDNFWFQLLSVFFLVKFGTQISKWTDKIKFEHLSKLSLWLVFSLPFERIPSLNLGVNLRISQILTILSLVFIIILVLKKDAQILRFKIQKSFIWLVLFYFFSVPSILFVQDFGRFVTTSVATFLAFFTCFLVAHFTVSIWQSLKYLLVSMTISGIFGVFQFFGDFLDFPTIVTGLRPQYTKAVFGYPRIQATAIEPLYFAGMLFLPLFFVILVLLNQRICKEFLSKEFAKSLESITKICNIIRSIFVKPKKNQLEIKNLSFNLENNLNYTNNSVFNSPKFTKTFINLQNSFTNLLSDNSILLVNSNSNFGQNYNKFQNFGIQNKTQNETKITKYLSFFSLFDRIFTEFKNILQIKLQIYGFEIFCWFFVAFFSFLFFFTLSKSGWLCFLIVLFPLLFYYRNHLSYIFWQRAVKFILLLGFVILVCNFNPDFNRIFGGTLNHFIETLSGESGTITERNNFLQAAFEILPNYAIFGIGSGQFGVLTKEILNATDNSLIVNNVYVEIWLEHGFLSLVCFLTFLILPFWQYFSKFYGFSSFSNFCFSYFKRFSQFSPKNFPKIKTQSNQNQKQDLNQELEQKSKNLELQNSDQNSYHNSNLQFNYNPTSLYSTTSTKITSLFQNQVSNPILQSNSTSSNLNWDKNLQNTNENKTIRQNNDQTFMQLIGQTLCCTLLAFCLQWLTFSPIFINPIFITLGLFLAYNQINQQN